MKKIVTLSFLIFVFSLSTFADIARPDRPKPTSDAANSSIMFTSDPSLKEAVLRIPEHEIRRLAAELDGNDSAAVNATQGYLNGGNSTIVISAAFLSLAFVFGGIWLVRSGKLSGNSAVAAFLIVFVVGATAIVYADIAPRPVPKTLTTDTFKKNVFTNKSYSEYSIKLETGGRNIVLTVPTKNEKDPKGEE